MTLLNQEPGYEKVKSLLNEASKSQGHILMNEVSLGEVYYSIAKGRSLADAERILPELLRLPIEFIPASLNLIISAAKIKARYPISYIDCFVVALAQSHGARIITGDSGFRVLEDLVEIEWI